MPHYVITSYYNNPDDPENFRDAKYYDSTDRLIREIGRDGDCKKYIYDNSGRLIEIVWGRTCEDGIRQIYVFDTSGHHVGYYRTRDTIVDLDTVQFEQIKFYDSQDRLIEEKVNERNTMDGVIFSTWNFYTYIGEIKSTVAIKVNDILHWEGTYHYDTKARQVELKKVRKERFETDYSIYNDAGQLIEQGTKTNNQFITPMGTFETPQEKIIFRYDTMGFMNEEIQYHDNKTLQRIIYIKQKEETNAP